MDSETPAMSPLEKGYALSGKILLSAIIVFFGILILLAVLHLYARWHLHRLRRRQIQRRRRRRTHIVFFVDNHHPNSAINQGLEKDVLDSLPLFVYSAKTHPELPECAVCLSEFEENETGRFLPKCNHSFHIECIDMWFHSHSTCPLCRSSVEPPEKKTHPAETVINVDDPIRYGNEAESDPGSSSGSWLCTTCQHEESRNTNTRSLGSRRKGLDLVGVRIEVPRTAEFDDELPTSSLPNQGFRSPGTRLMPFKRILSMNKKSPIGPSTKGACGAGTSNGMAGTTESDLCESSQESTRVQMPR